MAGRRQPGIESTQWSPLYGDVTLTGAQREAMTPGTAQNKAIKRGAKHGRSYLNNEFLGQDDFRRAAQAGNVGDFIKSAGTGALELGLTVAGGTILKGAGLVAKPVISGAGKVAAPVVGAAAKAIDTAAQKGARVIAPTLISTILAAGAHGAVPRALSTAFDTVKPAGIELVMGGKKAADEAVGAAKEGADELVEFAQGAKESVEQAGGKAIDVVKQKASDAVDLVKNLSGPSVNTADFAPDAYDVYDYQQQQQQEQQQQQSASGTGETGTGRPTEPETANKPRRHFPGLPDFSIKAGEDIKLPYTY